MDVIGRSLLLRGDCPDPAAIATFPPGAIRTDVADAITPESVRTLDGLFRERVRRSPGAPAYHVYSDEQQCWQNVTWSEAAARVARWQAGLRREALRRGDRVAVRMHNCLEWVLFDQAALALGLVVVPLYYNDRTENIAYVINDSGAKLLLVQQEQEWTDLRDGDDALPELVRIVCLQPYTADPGDLPVKSLSDWLPTEAVIHDSVHAADDLATIVYTSGTTGRPKGVMLSHNNILSNAYAGIHSIMVYPRDRFLSFLPLSHTLERTVGYYLPMMAGASVGFCRSIPQLAEDLVSLQPTILISVPRIFERIQAKVKEQLQERGAPARVIFRLAVAVGWQRFLHRQRRGGNLLRLLWPPMDRLVASKIRARLGGRLRCIICGGAALPPPVGRMFIAMGLPLQQGYGLTESSPVISVNTLERNDPASVGLPLRGVELRIGDDAELLVRGANVMLGYWNNHLDTYQTVDREGWLYTGDQARIHDGFLYITGRLKEILVLANGEKLPPVDLESAIQNDALFDQVLVVGDRRAFLSALVVLNPEQWQSVAADLGLDHNDTDALADPKLHELLLARIATALADFPGYANVYAVTALTKGWTVENDLLTPTLKPRRRKILERYADVIEAMYASH